MRASRAALLAVLLLAATVGACSAVAHLRALQPPTFASYHRLPPPMFRKVQAPKTQLGIQIDFYTYPNQDVAAVAAAEVAYVKSLHANALTVSFPFFANGPRSSSVHATNATPSPAELAVVASAAEKAGLYFSIRPLLDSASIGVSRTNWRPPRLNAWFASYRRFLMPYAQMSQKALIPVFISGAELSEFEASSRWATLDASLRAVFSGTIAYANNWGDQHPQDLEGVQEMRDAYHPVRVSDNASVARLTAGWKAYDLKLPPGTVLNEVGIAAQPGAYFKPYQVRWPGRPLVPAIQSRWFRAACNAIAGGRLGGIYFWALGFGQPLNVPPSTADPGSFVDGRGAVAISKCFMRLGSAAAAG